MDLFWATLPLLALSLCSQVSSEKCPYNITTKTITYKVEKTRTCCGVFMWARCTKYRQVPEEAETVKRVWDCCEGYSGLDCQQPSCFGKAECANGGTCVSKDNCSCPTMYTGENCEQALCFGNVVCENNGSCVAPDTCECLKSYTGQQCEREISGEGKVTEIDLRMLMIAIMFGFGIKAVSFGDWKT